MAIKPTPQLHTTKDGTDEFNALVMQCSFEVENMNSIKVCYDSDKYSDSLYIRGGTAYSVCAISESKVLVPLKDLKKSEYILIIEDWKEK